MRRSIPSLLVAFAALAGVGCDPLKGGWDGIAAFEDENTVVVVDRHGNYGRIEAPFDQGPDYVFDGLPFQVEIRSLFPQPGADRGLMTVTIYRREHRSYGQIVLKAWKTVTLDVSPEGQTPVLDREDYSSMTDAFVAADIAPHALIYFDGTGMQLQAGAVQGDPWITVAKDPSVVLASDRATLVVEGGGTAFAYSYNGRIVAATNGVFAMVHEPPWTPTLLDGDRATSGEAVFYVATETTAGWSVGRTMRTAAGWVDDPIAVVPGENGTFVKAQESLDAVNENCFAIITHTCVPGNCDGTLYAVMNEGAGWVVEEVADLESDPDSMYRNDGERGLSAAGCPPRIVTGTVHLKLHTRGPAGQWLTRDIARVGTVESGSCSVHSVRGSLATGIGMLLLALIGARALRLILGIHVNIEAP